MRSVLHRLTSLLILTLLSGSAFAQTREMTVVAGTGAAGFGGDGGAATSAQLNAPSEVTIGTDGDFYIADRDNHRVRRVDVATGVISTAAGSGVAGWYFEGGPAKFASLDHPSGVAVDTEGNVYIADLLDTGISRIHKVTVASGVIRQVQVPMILKGAVAIALDSAGNLYVAEEIGHIIRRVNLSSGTVSTVAGTGVPGFSGDGGPATSAQINGPAHLAFDSAGNFYFSDSLNNRIRKVAAGTGTISTVAGSGSFGGPGSFGGDGAAATSAHLNNPRGVAIDAAGNILIADTLNRRIRRVSAATGVITTIAGGEGTGDGCAAATSSLKSPESVAVNTSGNFIYIADDNGNRIWKVTLDLNTPPPTLSSIAPPGGIIGTAVAVTLKGAAFGGGGTSVPGGAVCRFSGATLFVGGAGVAASNVNVTSDTSITATFTIAPDAALGPRDVTVTTDSGTSSPAQFTVLAVPVPAPTLTSITPGTGARSAAGTFTLTGTNFDTHPGSTTVSAEGGGISITDVSVSSPTSLTATFTVAPDAALGNHGVSVSTAGGSSNAIPFAVVPQGPTFVYEIPRMLNPTDQTPVKLSLAEPLPDTVTAKLTLSFVPNATNPIDDPNVMFINHQASARTLDVTFSPNSGTAELSLPSGLLAAGTEAGTIQLAVADVQVAGLPATPEGTNHDVQIPQLPPMITNVRIINRTDAGFDVEITGYSTSREISSAIFTFGEASGKDLITVELTPDVALTFTTYYQSEVSGTVGGSFVYTQPFIVKQGDVKAVASVTVKLTNAQGTSDPKTAR
jgi:sugar lactone lactonase YvrE